MEDCSGRLVLFTLDWAKQRVAHHRLGCRTCGLVSLQYPIFVENIPRIGDQETASLEDDLVPRLQQALSIVISANEGPWPPAPSPSSFEIRDIAIKWNTGRDSLGSELRLNGLPPRVLADQLRGMAQRGSGDCLAVYYTINHDESLPEDPSTKTVAIPSIFVTSSQPLTSPNLPQLSPRGLESLRIMRQQLGTLLPFFLV